MPTILITTDYLTPGDEVDDYLNGLGFSTRHDPMRGPRRPGQLIAALAGVDGALIANEPISASVLAQAPTLRAIVRTGVGYDSVDVAAAARLGISVSNLPGINANAVPLDELLRDADFVSVHTALTDRTRNLLDAAALARMKPGAHLINTARGPIVDEDALVAAVRGGHLAGAALDVVAAEPLPAGSVLRGVDGITVYAHMAGQTAEARLAAGLDGARELVAALHGRPGSSVNAHLIAEEQR